MGSGNSEPNPNSRIPSPGRSVAGHLATVLIIASFVILPGLGNPTLWEPDEPRFAEATRQMFERSDFVTPYLNGAPRFEKPILLYWLQAASFRVVGFTELGARLPAALAGIGAVFVLYLLGSHVTSRRAALLAALAMSTMFRFVTLARIGLTDVPVLFFIVGALYGFIRGSNRRSTAALLFAWLCVGLGMLTKGPVGLLPVAIWTTYAAFSRDARLFANVRPAIGMSVALAVALPWYIVMVAEHGRAFIDFALGHEIIERFVSEASFAPARGFFYYLKVWPGDAAPWSVLFITAVIWASWKWSAIDRTTRQAIVLALAWFVCVFVLFSLSRSKIAHYVLPAYPAAALLIGVFVDRIAQTTDNALWWRLPMGAIAFVSMVAAAVTAVLLNGLVAGDDPVARWLVPVVLMMGAAAVAWATWKHALIPAAYALSGMLAFVFAVIGLIIVPRVIEPFKPMPRLAREAARVAQAGTPIGLLGRYGISSVVYYSRHDVLPLEDDDAAVAFLSTNTSALCIMPASDFQRLAPRLKSVDVIARAEEFNVRIEVLERQKPSGREWVLVRARYEIPPFRP